MELLIDYDVIYLFLLDYTSNFELSAELSANFFHERERERERCNFKNIELSAELSAIFSLSVSASASGGKP